MSTILDEEKKVTHKTLQDRIDKKLDDARFFKSLKVKLPSDFDNTQLDWAYGPTVQSGGAYDLKLSAMSDDNNLHAGIIICGLGLRYKSYTSMIARTFMVDPNSSQEQNYKLLISIQEMLLKEVKEGAVVKDLYNKALDIVKKKKPDLEKHFLKVIGGGIGFETRDQTLLITSKNTRQLKDGITLTLSPGFTDIINPEPQDSKSKKYSLYLCDTIRVMGKEAAASFTKDAGSEIGTISFYFKDEEEEPAPKEKSKKKDSKIGAVAANNIVASKLRDGRKSAKAVDEGAEQRRREHQKELALKKQREGEATYPSATGNMNGVEQKKFKKFESYKRDNQFPTRVADLAIVVDSKASTVVLPIMGRPVPFHINTIKNASDSNEGEFAYLRINFLSPGQGVGRKDDQPFMDPNAHFVRSLTFRSRDTDRVRDIAGQITELRKVAVRKEQEKKEMEDVVEQDKLVEGRKPQALDNVFIRPGLEGRRMPGEVHIHTNGLRYFDTKNQRVDILFSNIKHLFFQPSDRELIVIIHVHLKDPIMLGKRKVKDIQFYREATDMAFDETGNRKRKHRYGDEEEFEQEQEERRRRVALDKLFKSFAEKIENAAPNDLIVEIPYRDLGFNGVPFRSSVLMQPSPNCLIQLSEPPFTVLPLDEIEIVHLERVQFGLKNFDMVFVFKDYHRPVAHINTVPVEFLEIVKEWLDSVDICFTEGPLNLNWTQIMKTVTADPYQFFKEKGWNFLNSESDDEEDEEEEEESAFEMSESDFGGDESSEDSDFDDDASDDEGDASEDESDEGEDWDELERKAAKKDREGDLDDDGKRGKKGKKR